MKILTYILSLVLSGFVYLLFAAYMTVSAGLDSMLPLISFYCTILIFGFLSWFHFFKPTFGAILLTVSVAIMYFAWPFFLLIDYFDGDYQPAVIEFGIPLTLSFLTILSVWESRQSTEMKQLAKIVLAIPPLLLALYVGGYFTFKAFG
jgi:hypothetical protein